MSEQQLSSYDKRSIVRVGNTVHRPTGWWTPAFHELLKYLEKVGFLSILLAPWDAFSTTRWEEEIEFPE